MISKNLSSLIAIAIIAVALVLAITSVWNDSPIVDEIPHIGSGYSYIATGDARLNPEHPPLAKDVAGISLKILGIEDEPAFQDKSWQKDLNGQWEFGRKLIFNSDNDAIKLVRYAKIPELIFFILSGIIIFIWTRKLYGHPAGLIALFLFSFSPTVMAHSRFVTTDVPALFGILFATYFFLRYLEKPTTKNLWLAGFIFGVAELTKFSVFLLVPFFLGLALIYALLHSPKSKIRTTFYLLLSACFIIAIGYIFVVWPVYYFHTWKYPPELQKSQTTTLLESYGNRRFADPVIYFSDKPVIRALSEYGLGLLMVTQRAVGGNTTYFMGEVSKESWPQYFPIVYFLKEPLSFWFLLITIFLYWGAKMKIPNPKSQIPKIIDWSRKHFSELVMILWIVTYWYTSIRANLNIGVRHLMPVYGFTFILLSGQISKIIGNWKLEIGNWNPKIKIVPILIFGLLGWYLIENLSVYPYYLTYFNQVALLRPTWATEGQAYVPGGHNYVVDSNLDWGQDLRRLSDWVKENDVKKIALDYFGWADQSYYLGNNFNWIWAGKYKNAREFLVDYPNGGYIAVSASFYMGSREESGEKKYAWLDDFKPVTVIGNSIFVWYIPPLLR